MKVFLSIILFLALSICLVNSNSSAEEFSKTASQKHFTSIILQLKSFTKADWESPISLWVRASSKALQPDKQRRSQELADVIAERGRTALSQPFCVHIYQNRSEELATKCVY